MTEELRALVWALRQPIQTGTNIRGEPVFDIDPVRERAADFIESSLASPAGMEGRPVTPLHGMECATQGCGKPAAVHFIRGGVGSYYCAECYLKVQAIPFNLPAASHGEAK